MRPALRTSKPKNWPSHWPWAIAALGLAAAVHSAVSIAATAAAALLMGLAIAWRSHVLAQQELAAKEEESSRSARNIQDELMRLREGELLEHRMNKLASSVLLTRGDPEDLDQLIGWIDQRIEATGPDQAAECVSRFSTHLRNVFMASDTPRLPLDQSVDRVDRWVKFLRTLALFTIIHDKPRLRSGDPIYKGETNILLLLSVVEQWGLHALRQPRNEANFTLHWEVFPDEILLHCIGVADLIERDNALVLTIENAGGSLRSEAGHWLCRLPAGA
jgi:hypothetical protein